MTLAPGTKLGPYEILVPLGAGGMGEVWKAKDTRLDRFVAVKVLPEHLANHPESLARFEREAKAVAALNHPNITGIFDIGNTDGTAYVAMELLEGESLRTRLEQGPVTPRKATELAIQMAQGLAAAHEKGVVHRDLKPDNLWITKDGRLKILDFGLAKQLPGMKSGSESFVPTAAISPGHHTEKGMILGTLGYMSPEQVRGESVDARSDIFSFGVVLFEMLTGKRAFARDTAADTMAAILKEDPPELEPSHGSLPSGLQRVLRRCLEKDPAHRFHGAHDLAFALESLSGGSGSGAAGPAQATGRLPASRQALLLGAVLILAGLCVLAWFGGSWAAGRATRAVSFRPLTFRPQTIHAARFTPDGRTIVFSAVLKDRTPELFTLRADLPDPKPVGIPGLHLLAVSSKGELAVLTGAKYLAHNLFHGTLARMPLEGSAPRELLEGVREADWAPDGEALAVLRTVGGKDRLEFPVGTVLAETDGYFSDLRISPQGDRIAFFEHTIRWDDQGRLAVVDRTGRRKVLSGEFWGMEGLAWTPDGKEVLFSAGEGYESFAVHSVSLSGRSRIALQSAGGLTLRDTSRSGGWLVTQDAIMKEMRVLAPGQTQERDLAWLDSSQNAVLSLDGRRVVFSEQNGRMGLGYAICMRGTDGSPVVRLGEGANPDLSSDGKWVVSIVPSNPHRLMLYPTGAGEARRLETGGIVSMDEAHFFPDGRRILVSGREAGRRNRCFVVDLAGGTPRPLTPEGATFGIVSPDGALILTWEEGRGLAMHPAGGGEGKPLPGSAPEEFAIGWAHDGRSLLTFRGYTVPAQVQRVDPVSGRRENLRKLGPPDSTGVHAISEIRFSADESAYVYGFSRTSSKLFAVEGAR